MQEPLGPGSVIEGRFRIERALGAGGMGVVYLARHLALGRDVALKLHRAGGGSRATQRLSREAQAMARLSHPNVLTVFDVGSLANGSVFIAMEYVDGPTLRGRQDQLRAAGDWRGIVELYREAAKGISAAHDKGLVHRDFKPDNVLIGTDGRVRVADFGIARALGGADDEDGPTSSTGSTGPTGGALGTVRPTVSDLGTPMTATGALLGTPAYMAPEQYGAGPVEAPADQFAFCVALYEGLFGSRPFAGNNPGELYYNISQQTMIVPELGPVPQSVFDTIRRGLAFDPAHRFESIDALAQSLACAPEVRPPSSDSPRPSTGKGWPVLAVGVLVVLGVVGGLGWYFINGRTPPATPGSGDAPTDVPREATPQAATVVSSRWEAIPEGPERFATPPAPIAPALPANALVRETVTCEGRESMFLSKNRITPRDGRALVAQGHCHLIIDGVVLDGTVEVRGDARLEIRGSTVSGEMGLTVRDRATVRMIGGRLDGESGGDLDGEGALRLEGVTFEGHGALVKARGGIAELSEISVTRRGVQTDALVWAGGEAVVRVEGGALAAKTVLELTGDSRTVVAGTSISGARAAYRVGDRATLQLEGATVKGKRKVANDQARVVERP